MHEWGDDWFKQYGDRFYTAIDKIENYLHKHHIGICGKEKYGTYRDEYLTLWNGGLYQILFGYRLYIQSHIFKPKWLSKICNKIHTFIYFKLDRPCSKCGLVGFNRKIGLAKFVNDIQAKHYNKIFQRVLNENPDMADELVSDIDGYKMIKPCKWGNWDGVKIHEKYWKSL